MPPSSTRSCRCPGSGSRRPTRGRLSWAGQGGSRSPPPWREALTSVPEGNPITVTDRLPAGTLSGTPTVTGWDCSGFLGASVSCTYPASASAPIPAGTTLPPITVPVVFGPNESGIFTNSARVTSQDNASTPQASSASDTFRVLPTGQDDSATTDIGVPVGRADPVRRSWHPTARQRGQHQTAGEWDSGVERRDRERGLHPHQPGWSGIATFTCSVSGRLRPAAE